MDEPTSGLDSFQAQAVMGRCARPCRRWPHGRRLHPPARLLDLSDARSSLPARQWSHRFFGAAGDALAAHFARAGHPIPPSYNPSDFVIDLISVDFRDPLAAKTTAERLEALLEAWAAHEAKQQDAVPPATSTAAIAAGASANTTSTASTASKKELLSLLLDDRLTRFESCSNAVTAFKLLTQRCLQELTRDKIALLMKYVAQTFFSVLFGLVYFQMDKSQTSLQNRTGILFFTAMNLAFGTTIDTSSVIPAQLAVVSRERAARMYSILPYYLPTWLCRVPLDVLPNIAFSARSTISPGCAAARVHFLSSSASSLSSYSAPWRSACSSRRCSPGGGRAAGSHPSSSFFC